MLAARCRGVRTLALITACALSARTGFAQAAASRPGADMILTGGRVVTADSAHPWATAIAIRGDRIPAVGGDAEIERLRSPRTRRIALSGTVVVPGFNDAHTHLGGGIKSINFATSLALVLRC